MGSISWSGGCGATISVSKHSAASGPRDGYAADDVCEYGAANRCPGGGDAANNLSKHGAARGCSGDGATKCNPGWSKCPGDFDTTWNAVSTTWHALRPGRWKCSGDSDRTGNAVRATWHSECAGDGDATRIANCATWHAVHAA